MGYTRAEILQKCKEAFRNIPVFYKADVVNYRGITTDTGELYSELVSGFIIDDLSGFCSGIPEISRSSSYFVKEHDGHYDPGTNRVEEITAMQLYSQCKDNAPLDHIGSIIDYQTPLKNVRADKAGKIDLLSIIDRTVYILELKKSDSTETMLRCVLEGYTYLKTADRKKLLSDFKLPDSCEVKASPLVFYGGVQWAEMQGERPALKQLMKMLDCKPFYLTEKSGKYYVTEE
ncbi:MAG: hypothetical protein J1F11_05705 [Oscillospiraceae bacterium]|nr:hypothetical protein [Oscillospiraceae bacterium]